MIHLGLPQLIFIAVYLMGYGIILTRCGEPRRGNYGIADLVISPSITIGLLYWGGFFG